MPFIVKTTSLDRLSLMPPKRKRTDDDDQEEVLTPRTPKKTRTIDAATPTSIRQSGQRSNNKHAASVTPSLAGDLDEDDDDLTASQTLSRDRRSPRKAATPLRYRQSNGTANGSTPRRKASVLDTPSKSASTRKKSVNSVQTDGQGLDQEEDPAANLILQVAGDDDSEEDEVYAEIHSDVDEDGQKANGISLEGGFEAYFEQASRKIKTSDNTLSKMPDLPQRDFLDIIKHYKLPYADAAKDLYKSHVMAFPEWSFELDQNYSLCLYGFGSKRALIMDFVKQESHEYGDPYVVINGYHPSVDLRQICQAITGGLEASGADPQAVLNALDRMSYDRLILAFHNIDGQNLRNDKTQGALCKIIEHPKIRMICSIDHINAPLLWSSSRAALMGVLYHDATTFLPYHLETELQSDTLSTSKKAQLTGDRGIKWILQTLSQNARTIFRLLLVEQIETGVGVETTRLYEKASQAFAVSNHQSYQAQLGEFLDHEIIVVEKESGIGRVLKIPFDKADLSKLLIEIDEDLDDA